MSGRRTSAPRVCVQAVSLVAAAFCACAAGAASPQPAASAPTPPASNPSPPAPSPAPAASQPATVFHGTQFELHSAILDRSYLITVYVPLAPPPPAGYPLVLHTDGFYFPIAATAETLLEFGGARPAVVVGINWAVSDPALGLRYRTLDLTPPTDPATVPPVAGQSPPKAEDYGGAEAFRTFIVSELLPALAARQPLDAADRTLYGHSFGGLFALYVLFSHTADFQTYLIASPSIFWNRRSILAGEAAFAARVRAGSDAPRVLLMVGGREQFARDPPPPGQTREQAAALAKDADMVGNVRALARRLAALPGRPGYTVAAHVFADDDHLGSITPSLARGLAFAARR